MAYHAALQLNDDQHDSIGKKETNYAKILAYHCACCIKAIVTKCSDIYISTVVMLQLLTSDRFINQLFTDSQI